MSAWRLTLGLAACCLRLAASRGPVTILPGPRFMELCMILVFRVCDMFHVSGPAASTAAALLPCLGGRAVAALINNRGPMGPGLSGLGVILCIDNLIVKFPGMSPAASTCAPELAASAWCLVYFTNFKYFDEMRDALEVS